MQPSSNASALNRVLGSDVSVIQGALKANGQVFLVNPNGVLFTPTAQVNVGGIVASTLNISTADFMAGDYKFEGNPFVVCRRQAADPEPIVYLFDGERRGHEAQLDERLHAHREEKIANLIDVEEGEEQAVLL